MSDNGLIYVSRMNKERYYIDCITRCKGTVLSMRVIAIIFIWRSILSDFPKVTELYGGSAHYIGLTYLDFPLTISIYCPIVPTLTGEKFLPSMMKCLKRTYNKNYPKAIYQQIKMDK